MNKIIFLQIIIMLCISCVNVKKHKIQRRGLNINLLKDTSFKTRRIISLSQPWNTEPSTTGYYKTLYGRKYTGRVKKKDGNRNIRVTGRYLAGKKSGVWKFYLENGQLLIIGHYIKNYPTNTWILFEENGNIKETLEYNYGRVGDYKAFDQFNQPLAGNELRTARYHSRLYDIAYQPFSLD